MKKLIAIALLALVIINPHRGRSKEAIFPIALVAAAIPAIISMFKGRHDVSQGKKIAAGNIAPTSRVALPWYDIVQETEKAASLGLDPTTSLAMTMGNRGMAASLRALVEAGGDPNDVAGVYDQYSDNLLKAAGINFERQSKMANDVVNAMAQLAGAQATDFLYNQDRPFKDTAQLAAGRMNAGEDQFNQGTKLLTYAAMSAASNFYKPDTDPTTQDHPELTPPVGNVVPKLPEYNINAPATVPTGRAPQPLKPGIDYPQYDNPWSHSLGENYWNKFQKIGYG